MFGFLSDFGGLRFPTVFEDVFDFVLVSPSPGGPGGLDCHLFKDIGGLGPISARIRWETNLLFLVWP